MSHGQNDKWVTTRDGEDEIIETGISMIEVETAGHRSKTYIPAGTRAKWFRDELGQLWVKFDEAPEGSQEDGYWQHVIPAGRVIRVTYRKDVPSIPSRARA